MSSLNPLGLGIPRLMLPMGNNIERVIVHRPLQSVLRFLGRTIDDVINDPIARNEVYGFYKLHRWVQRGCETVDLERWWNGEGV